MYKRSKAIAGEQQEKCRSVQCDCTPQKPRAAAEMTAKSRLLLACFLSFVWLQLASASWRDKNYLIPILRAGPNNQLRHLRFALAFAKQLNRTLVLTGIKKHYTDRGLGFERNGYTPLRAPSANSSSESEKVMQSCFKERTPHFIEFEEVLDRQYVQEYHDVITHQELKQAGWNGVVDAIVLPNGTSTERWLPYFSMAALAVGCEMYHTVAVVQINDFFRCNPKHIQALVQRTQRQKVVMMQAMTLGWAEAVELTTDIHQPRPQPGCWQDLWEANRRLRSNVWLQNIATRYIQQHIGTHDFLALHLRPQTDICFKYWMNRKFVVKDMWNQANCWRGHEMLHEQFANRTLDAMRKYNMTTLFVMTHPFIRDFISEKLKQVGLNPIYMDSEQVAEIAGCIDTSSTFLALVEMQVGVQASVLLGTASSSITETVVYERLAQGHTQIEFVDRPFLPFPPPPARLPAPASTSGGASSLSHAVHMAPWAGKGAGRRHNNDAGGQNQQAQQSRRQQEQQVVVAAGLSGSKMGVDQHRQQVSEADVKAVGELALTKLQQDLQRRQQQDGQQVASS